MLLKQILVINDSLKSGDIFKIKQIFDYFLKNTNSNLITSSEFKKYKTEIEKNYYRTLSKFIASRQFEAFRQLVNYSDKLEIFIDVKKIPFRFEIISDLHLIGIQSGQIGAIFDVIRFYNEYNLFDRDFTNEELRLLEDLKKDKLLLENLKDLFGKVTNSLVFYACKIIPYDLYILYKNYFNTSLISEDNFYPRSSLNISNLLRYFDRYSVYGLSVENMGNVKGFIRSFERHYLKAKNEPNKQDLNLLQFKFKRKTHLVSINNILKNKDKILGNEEKYDYFSLSMVLLGGLGPQGHGFTYSTPRGEIIEICSDIKENDAIIIKYKQFLKRQFLKRLNKEMAHKNIDTTTIQKIIDYLLEIINEKEIINYYKKDLILEQINSFLRENLETYYNNNIELHNLMNKISNAMKIILRPIKMEDQFKTRMYLVDEDKVKSEDIAKLTSLKDKSHYDVLRERSFFQNEIKWFFNDYSEEFLKFEDIL